MQSIQPAGAGAGAGAGAHAGGAGAGGGADARPSNAYALIPPPAITPATITTFSFSSLFGTSSSSRTRPRTASGPEPASASAYTASFARGTAGASLDSPFQDSSFRFRTSPRKNSATRKPSLGDLASYSLAAHSHQDSSAFKTLRRRARSSSAIRESNGVGASLGILRSNVNVNPNPNPDPDPDPFVTDNGNPPALPGFALPSAARVRSRDAEFPHPSTSRSKPNSMDSSGSRMLSRTGTLPANGLPAGGPGSMMPPPSATTMQSESSMVHQHIQEMANKRISTLEYLRKAHEGRVYWFNTLLFDKPDLARMPYFDTRRLARRATNYLLLGLSLPTVIDLNSNTPTEFLRTLNVLLSEFESFQQLHPENGSSASSALARARIPNLNVFRRATPSAKARRSSSTNNEILYEDTSGPALPLSTNGSIGGGGGGGSISGPSSAEGNMGLGGSASVVSFGQSEADLLPGEEYVHLLTPSLPFDPDFFETFATLCDVLIDAYTRLLGLLPTPRECNASIAEMFTKADSRVRKIIVQGIVKEFEDTSRNGVRTEVANVGKVVLSGLM